MISEISQAYTGVKAIKEVFSFVLAAKIDASAQEKVNDALRQLGDVQDNLFIIREKLSALQEENIALKQSLSEKEAFNSKMSLYPLTDTPGGAVVHEYTGDPSHYACPRCIASIKEIHILQDLRIATGRYECSNCKNRYAIQSPMKTDGSVDFSSGVSIR